MIFPLCFCSKKLYSMDQLEENDPNKITRKVKLFHFAIDHNKIYIIMGFKISMARIFKKNLVSSCRDGDLYHNSISSSSSKHNIFTTLVSAKSIKYRRCLIFDALSESLCNGFCIVGLPKVSGQRTVPNIFVNGRHLGGYVQTTLPAVPSIFFQVRTSLQIQICRIVASNRVVGVNNRMPC